MKYRHINRMAAVRRPRASTWGASSDWPVSVMGSALGMARVRAGAMGSARDRGMGQRQQVEAGHVLQADDMNSSA